MNKQALNVLKWENHSYEPKFQPLTLQRTCLNSNWKQTETLWSVLEKYLDLTFSKNSRWSGTVLTSSRSVLMSFWAAAAAAAGTGTLGVLVISTGALGRISVGTRPGDTGPRYGLTSAVVLVARLGVTENMGWNGTQGILKLAYISGTSWSDLTA